MKTKDKLGDELIRIVLAPRIVLIDPALRLRNLLIIATFVSLVVVSIVADKAVPKTNAPAIIGCVALGIGGLGLLVANARVFSFFDRWFLGLVAYLFVVAALAGGTAFLAYQTGNFVNDNPDAGVWIILVGVVVAFVAIIRWLTLGITPTRRRQRRRIRKARWTLAKRIVAHKIAIMKAGFSATAIDWKQTSLVAKAKEDLDYEEGPKGRLIDSLAGVELYERWIETPHGGGPLENVGAHVESTGDVHVTHGQRPTLTRTVGGAILGKTVGHPWKGALGAAIFAQKPTTSLVDNREVYLYVEAPSFSSVVECGSTSGKEARDLAAMINTQSKRFAEIQRALPAKREAARRRHAEAKATAESEIRVAQNALHSVKRDNSHTAGIEAARQELAKARNALRRKRE
jgi:hypothetical protein